MREPLIKICKTAMSVALAFFVLFGATGCRETDVLKELINDQSSPNIDYDNPVKLYNNVPYAKLTSEDFPQMQESAEATIERERKNVNAVKGESEVDDEVADEKPQEDNESGKKEDKKSDGKKGKGKSGKGKKGKSGKGGDSAKKNSKGKGNTESGGAGGKGATVDLTGTDEPEQNAYDSVVAFGECANIVMMLAGKGSLAGSDADFLNNAFIKDAYSGQGIDKVAKIKTKNGTSFDVAQVVKAKPEALFIMNDTFEVTDAQAKKLKKADIDVVYLPGPNSHTNIKALVKLIGTMFGDGSQTLSGADAKQKAKDYCDWANEQVKSISKKNGGLMTYGGVNYDTGKVDTSKAVTTSIDDTEWTLYVYDWDDDAVYDASPNKTHLWDAEGVALTKTGWTWSPLSYYMSVGGVNNNAAQFHVTKTKPTSLYYIWQFNLSYMPASASHFSGTTITASKLENFSDSDVLVRTQDEDKTYSLGCDNFRNVIVKNREIQSALEKARDDGTKKQEGLYAAYNYQNDHGQTGIGLFAKPNVLVPSYIGYVAGTKGTLHTHSSTAYERYENGENPYEVITNPHGLYSSWTDGSIESVLECAWVYDLYHSNGDFSVTEKTVREFYETFYGYDVSENVDVILAGLEK